MFRLPIKVPRLVPLQKKFSREVEREIQKLRDEHGMANVLQSNNVEF